MMYLELTDQTSFTKTNCTLCICIYIYIYTAVVAHSIAYIFFSQNPVSQSVQWWSRVECALRSLNLMRCSIPIEGICCKQTSHPHTKFNKPKKQKKKMKNW